jgi:hypothetical protein
VLDRSAKLAERWTKLASLELRKLVRSLVQQIRETHEHRHIIAPHAEPNDVQRSLDRSFESGQRPKKPTSSGSDEL